MWHLLLSADKTSCAQKRQYKEMKVVVAGFSLLFSALFEKPKTYWGLFWFAVEARVNRELMHARIHHISVCVQGFAMD